MMEKGGGCGAFCVWSWTSGVVGTRIKGEGGDMCEYVIEIRQFGYKSQYYGCEITTYMVNGHII